MTRKSAILLAAFEALVLLPTTTVLLKTLGYWRTRRLLGTGSGAAVTDAPQQIPEQVREVSRAVMGIARWSPMQTKCLARALVIELLARRRGYALEVVIGVASPIAGLLQAHAWVEHAGVPVNDALDIAERFPPIN